MKFISALLGIALFLMALTFALSNRDPVSVSLWPFDEQVTAPLYLFTLGALGVGILFGSFFIWLGTLPHRFKARRLGKDVVQLSGRILELEQDIAQMRARDVAHGTPLLAAPAWQFWKRS